MLHKALRLSIWHKLLEMMKECPQTSKPHLKIETEDKNPSKLQIHRDETEKN